MGKHYSLTNNTSVSVPVWVAVRNIPIATLNCFKPHIYQQDNNTATVLEKSAHVMAKIVILFSFSENDTSILTDTAAYCIVTYEVSEFIWFPFHERFH